MDKRQIVKGWAALPVAASLMAFGACYEDLDLSYNGDIDLNQLVIRQAADIWDGTHCNVETDLEKGDEDADNFVYELTLAIYQNRVAGQEVTADLVVASDSLEAAIAMAGESSVYSIYEGAELLPEEYYTLSGSQLRLLAGDAESEAVDLTVFSQELIDYVQDERRADALFVLPLRIQNSTSYPINSKVCCIMFFFEVGYVAPDDGGEYPADSTTVERNRTSLMPTVVPSGDRADYVRAHPVL